jgi:putative ATP-binding cassette transporter
MAGVFAFLRDVWSLSHPYFRSEDRWVACGLLAALVLLNLGLVYLNVLFNEWNNLFYTSLQDKDWLVFIHQLVRFSWLAALFIAVAVYQLYLNQMLQIRWRQWLTSNYLDRWLTNRTYYRLQITDRGTDNPDQRIAEDLRAFVASTLSLSLGLLSAIVTLISFSGVLWGLSGPLPIQVAGHQFAIPGYMVWAAIVYALLGTWLANRIGRRLATLNFDQQRYEADFRFGLVRLRENSEAIAMDRGEPSEKGTLLGRFHAVAANWWAIMKQQKRLTWYTAGYNQVAIVFPFLVASPRYFSGALQLGGLMQTASAFGQVQQALSFCVNAYSDVATWKSVVDRLVQFREAMGRIEGDPGDHARLQVVATTCEQVALDELALATPNGADLIAAHGIVLLRRTSTLITGPSGIGKSTLFRAIAGVWPFGKGRILVPKNAHLMFIPQLPYLPIGRLRNALTYPHHDGAVDEATLREALIACRLPQLADCLDDERHWSLCLSPGEQQRIAFARIFIQRPDWIFLDEATAALDQETEAALYHELARRLPETTVVSVGHRPSLAAFHQRKITIARDGALPRLIEQPEPTASTVTRAAAD